ncbi:MAG TPA: hypothetical protein VFW07_07265 [Parafilimonas sp.]|nr:hypothetical protein [Parafilimonas sp.]
MKTKQNKPETNFNKWIIIVLVGLGVISIAGLIILDKRFTLDDKSFGREVGNMFLQIISVGVVGTILSLLLAKYNKQQEELLKRNELIRISNENTNQFKKEIIQQLNKIYSNTKSVRRMLRAKGFSIPYYDALEKEDAILRLKVYDNAVEQLNSFQLELEMILKELETNGSSFSDANSISGFITQMERYLGNIVSEYEEKRTTGVDKNSLEMKNLNEIKTLIEHTGEKSEFRLGFIEPYKKAVGAIRKELLDGVEHLPLPNTL